MYYIGIDPGAKGALSIISKDGTVDCIPYNKQAYLNALASLPVCETFCVIEKVGARPHQGVTSMFHFGEAYGWLQGVLECLGVPYQAVTPGNWKKSFGCTADKASSVQAAQRLFPRVDLRRTPRSFKNDDNIAESLLMAEYARRIYKG